ncbi:MAG: alpha/beta hydrolase, partial [Cyclobacteriaceae bacterium]
MNKALVENNIPAAAEFFVRSWYDGPLRNVSELDSAKRKKVTRMVEETLRNHKRTHWPRFKENSSINHLGQVQIPVCIIEGMKDNRVISLNCDTLSSILSNSKRIVIDNAAHMPNLDNSEEFNCIIKDFIQKSN